MRLLDAVLVYVLDHQQNFDAKFRQDNAATHVSWARINEFRLEKGILIAWPACSPDLNPIEKMWVNLCCHAYDED